MQTPSGMWILLLCPHCDNNRQTCDNKHRREFSSQARGDEKILISSLCTTLAVGQSGACVADSRVFVKGEVVAWLQVSQLCSKLLTVETSAWLAAVLLVAALWTHGIQFVTLEVFPRPRTSFEKSQHWHSMSSSLIVNALKSNIHHVSLQEETFWRTSQTNELPGEVSLEIYVVLILSSGSKLMYCFTLTRYIHVK